MERMTVLAPGEYYHVYNRGVEKRDIFITNADYERFVRTLHLANSKRSFVSKTLQGRSLDEIDVGERCVAIGAYVLMPNHFHILLKEIGEGGITSFMGKLQTGYSMYFNKCNTRVGPLFQGRFKAEHVGRDEHLKYLYAYIHLNPLQLIEPRWKHIGLQNVERAEKYIQSYIHSSYLDYAGVHRQENTILSTHEFPEYFAEPRDFRLFVNEWISMPSPRAALG